MRSVFIIILTVLLTPGLGIMSLLYSVYLFIRKKPSSQKQMFISSENMNSYAKGESFIFALWGFDIIALGLLIKFSTNQLILMIGVIILLLLLSLGYYLRMKNDKKYLIK